VVPSAVPASIGNPAGFDLFPKPPRNENFQCSRLLRKLCRHPQACLGHTPGDGQPLTALMRWSQALRISSGAVAFGIVSLFMWAHPAGSAARPAPPWCSPLLLQLLFGASDVASWSGLVTLIGSIVGAGIAAQMRGQDAGVDLVQGHGDRPSCCRQRWDFLRCGVLT
jgi:hypothetical protein